MPTVKELGEKRCKAIADARKILDKADAEKRDMTVEERKSYDDFWSEGEKLKDQMKEVHGDDERRRKLREAEERMNEPQPRQGSDADGDLDRELAKDRGDGPKREMRWKSRLGEERVIAFPELVRDRQTPQYRDIEERYLRTGKAPEQYIVQHKTEQRTLQVDSGSAGGLLLSPEMAGGILHRADDVVHIRSIADITTLGQGTSLGIPTEEAAPDDADWTGELSDVTEDTSMSFGRRELVPHALTKKITLSRKLVRQKPDIRAYIERRLGYKLGVALEKGYMTGHGANQPLGIFTASSNGISTARDIATSNTTTAFTDLGLLAAYYGLKAAYRDAKTCRWLMHRDGVRMARGLKDSQGGYLLRPGQGIETNNGDRLLGVPLLESEYAPNTFTTGLYVGIIGDFKYYAIADSLLMEIQVVDQRLAHQNKIEYILRAESDGMPTFEEAFARVKLG